MSPETSTIRNSTGAAAKGSLSTSLKQYVPTVMGSSAHSERRTKGSLFLSSPLYVSLFLTGSQSHTLFFRAHYLEPWSSSSHCRVRMDYLWEHGNHRRGCRQNRLGRALVDKEFFLCIILNRAGSFVSDWGRHPNATTAFWFRHDLRKFQRCLKNINGVGNTRMKYAKTLRFITETRKSWGCEELL